VFQNLEPIDLDAVVSVKPDLAVRAVAPGTVYFVGEGQRFVVSDSRVALLTGLVDGQKTVGQILEQVVGRLAEPEVLFVLTRLVKSGYLVTSRRKLQPEVAGFWTALGFDAVKAREALRAAPVSLTVVGDAKAGVVREALGKAGIKVEDGASLQVVVTDDYLRGEISRINQKALRDGTSFCLVKPAGIRPLAGPLFRPGEGPCWECLAFYMRSNRPVEELLRGASQEELSLPQIYLKATLQAAAGLAAVALANALVCSATHMEHPLHANLLAVDLPTLGTAYHRVMRRPQCKACGDPALTAALGEQPVELHPVEKGTFEDGGYRRQSPRQTFRTYSHLISPLSGPVTHLLPVPGRDTELRAVYASGYMVLPRGPIPTSNTFDRGCAGKGCGADQAKVSALCEALERFSGVYQGDEARLRASTLALGDQALPLAELLNFSEEQYRTRDVVGKAADVRASIPEPLDPATEIDWAYGWSLTRNERRYVPFTFCYSEAPPESGTAYCQANGNGVAAGTCLEEALLQGLLELVERDAAAVWWYNRIRRPVFDLAGFHDSYIDQLVADYARLGWKVWVLDITHDLGIPVGVAVGHRERDDRFVIGFGCHLEARIAVKRALTELNQLFDPDNMRKNPWESPLLSHDHLFGDLAPTSAPVGQQHAGGDLRADLEACMQPLHRAGLEVVAVNKTRPDVGLSVVSAVVPGLRHFWPRFGPGRLYSVPCEMGWRKTPATEHELNPVPLLL
jgi:oxazoline/thiazoline synthase